MAAVILEVPSGLRTPTDASQATGISLPRYYVLETRGLHGLISALEARPKGKQKSPASTVAALGCEKEKLQRELLRAQALVRVAQRSVGLKERRPEKVKPGERRRRRPNGRALQAVKALRRDTPETAEQSGQEG
jgi:hypothetical protein